MSVLTGIAPSELLALDGEMFSAVLDATLRTHTSDDTPAPIARPTGKPERVGVLRLADIGGTGVERVGVSK